MKHDTLSPHYKMKTSVLVIAGFSLLHQVNGHYTFGRLIFKNIWTKTWEYIRQISPDATVSDPEIAWIGPKTEPGSMDLRCGRNESIAWFQPNTATIDAGDIV
ncbi:hypothetical protein K504DRAFT_447315 [Pleomassaria siparia CBS 279.74]|uniref:Uncharacterized protein n=1 Tax=Pleomassaria siparia CBS 279.74 TaxID=1314801 RepID=A0A6G1K461_9PLEO|nr:hypothetical protein K504DRAFT_447315 [Pleomassaria siparia CBS 279.74]